MEGSSPQRTISISGTYFGKDDSRVVRINDFHIYAMPEGYMLVCENEDKPGVRSYVSSILAKHDVDIAEMTVDRQQMGGNAISVINTDSHISAEMIK